MKKMIFTPLAYRYEIHSWNPVVETQERREPIEIGRKEELTSVSVEDDYISHYKKIWDELSKY